MEITNKWQKGSLLGGIIAGFIASLCCVGPIIFALLGIGSVTALAFFSDYSLIFVGIAAIFWSIAAYFTYRKRGSKEECEEDEYCARLGAERTNQILLWLSAVVILLFTFSSQIISILS